MFFLLLGGAFVGIKAYGAKMNEWLAPAGQAAVTTAQQTAAGAGSAPGNTMGASPSPAGGGPPPVATDDGGESDDGDDGAMTATVMAVTGAVNAGAPGVGPGDFDLNETQSSSGSDNAASHLWRRRGPAGGINRILNRIWREVLDVDYVSAQPGIAYYYAPPPVTRQDWNPALNNQPWSRNDSFMSSDPTSYFEADGDGVPSDSNVDDEDC